jgi:hypothetical protein
MKLLLPHSFFIQISCVLMATFLQPLMIFSQQPDETDVQEIIENFARSEDAEDFSFDASIDDLENLKKRPLDLNKASRGEIAEIVLLSPQQIAELQKYILKHGKLISIYELQAIPLWDVETIKAILPYVKVDESLQDLHVPIKDLFTKGNTQWVSLYQQQIERSNGYRKPEDLNKQFYQGLPFRLQTRFRYTYGTQMSYGFTADKDPGEEFFSGSNRRGFDFYSGHFFIRNRKQLRALVLGDYEVRLGQGLIMWTGFGFRKSPAVMMVKRESPKLRPYTSINEFRFLRGSAFTLGFKNWEVTAFASYKLLDANVSTVAASDTSFNEDEFFSSILETGLHRTQSEIAKRERVSQLTTGGNFSYNKKNWHVGANALYMRYFTPFVKDKSPYALFDFASQQLVNVSVDYHIIFRNIHFFGENGVCDRGGFGLLNGAMLSLDKRVDMSVVHRYYSKDFQTIYANAFAERSRPQNEHGLYIGMTVRPIRYVQLDGFFDLYMHPWLKYLVDAPSWGNENYFQATVRPNKRSEIYLRYRFETRKRNSPANDLPFDYVVNETRQGLRYHHRFRVTDDITISNRVELSFYNIESKKSEVGYMFYQDIGYKKMGFPLSAHARFAIFRTPSFNTRIFTYENDVLYSFSIPALYGNGIRYYLVLRYSATRWLDFWVRWAQTFRSDVKSIGSGLDQIEGNKRSEVKVQMRVRF